MSALAAASEDCRNWNKASLADWANTIKDMKILTQKLHLKPNVQVLLIADSYQHEQFHKFSLKEKTHPTLDSIISYQSIQRHNWPPK